MNIFEKIIKGEIPAHKIYEDDKVLAFLDINPEGEGHTLVIPKKPVEFVWDMEEKDYQYLMLIAKKLALHLRQQLPYTFVKMAVVGTDVPHAHVHLIPFNPGAIRRNQAELADQKALTELAKKLFIEKI